MEIISWLFKEEEPPQSSVFEAEQKWSCGFKHRFLIVQPYLERIERQRAYNANKEPANVKGEAENNAGGGESGTPSIKDTNITSQDVVFGSNAKSAQKLGNQMTNRGWTEEIVNQTIDAPYTTRASINKATGNSATVFYTQQGSYVIVDDVTKAIVQVSDNINPATWVPDSSIVDPYIPQ